MVNEKERSLVEQLLQDFVDPVLTGHQFLRRKSSIEYNRLVFDAKQSINMAWNKAKHSDDPSILHIHPVLSVEMPAITETVNHIIGNGRLLGDTKDVTLVMTIGLTGPERHLVDWRFVSEIGIVVIGTSIADYLNKWAVPFLDQYKTTADLIQGFEAKDERLPRGNTWILKIAAAYIVLGDVRRARELLFDEFYPKLGLRKKYAQALEFVEKL